MAPKNYRDAGGKGGRGRIARGAKGTRRGGERSGVWRPVGQGDNDANMAAGSTERTDEVPPVILTGPALTAWVQQAVIRIETGTACIGTRALQWATSISEQGWVASVNDAQLVEITHRLLNRDIEHLIDLVATVNAQVSLMHQVQEHLHEPTDSATSIARQALAGRAWAIANYPEARARPPYVIETAADTGGAQQVSQTPAHDEELTEEASGASASATHAQGGR